MKKRNYNKVEHGLLQYTKMGSGVWTKYQLTKGKGKNFNTRRV